MDETTKLGDRWGHTFGREDGPPPNPEIGHGWCPVRRWTDGITYEYRRIPQDAEALEGWYLRRARGEERGR